MAEITPYLKLYKPGGGSSGLIAPDERVDVDRLNTNSDLIDADAKTRSDKVTVLESMSHQYRGPAADKGAITAPKDGDTYLETDGSKVLWKRAGGEWVREKGQIRFNWYRLQVADGSPVSDAVLAVVPARSTNPNLATVVTGSKILVQPGTFMVLYTLDIVTYPAVGRTMLEMSAATPPGPPAVRNSVAVGDNRGSLTFPLYLSEETELTFQFLITTGQQPSVSGTLTIVEL